MPSFISRATLFRGRSPLHPWLSLPDAEMLRAAGLYRKDHQTGQEGYTLAAALLFGSDEVVQSVMPHYRTDALVRITDLNRYHDRLDIRTNLIDAYELLMQFIDKHLPDKFYLEGDQRINLREKIFREIVANLIVHREYTNGAPARLIIYADRIETDNANKPHQFGPINPQGFAPFPKNPYIAKFFQQMGRVDELGSGVRNIMHYTPHYAPGRQAQLLEEDMFKAIIPVPVSNKAPQSETGNDGVNEKTGGANGGADGAVEGAGGVNDGVNGGAIGGATKGVKEKLTILLTAIATNKGQRIPYYELQTGFPESTIEKYKTKLRKAGLVEFRGDAAQTGGYYLTKKVKALLS